MKYPLLEKRLSAISRKPDLFDFFHTHTTQKPRFIKKGTVLFNDGDPLNHIYFINKGFIKLYKMSPQGRETVIYLTGPGNILGLRAFTSDDSCAHHYAEALTNAEIITMTRQEYISVLATHPAHIIDLLYSFIERLNHAEKRLEGFITTDTPTRVAYFLMDCITRYVENPNPPFDLPLPLTHQKIAEFVGSFRETVTHAMKKLEQEKILHMKNKTITILDLEKLQSYTSHSS